VCVSIEKQLTVFWELFQHCTLGFARERAKDVFSFQMSLGQHSVVSWGWRVSDKENQECGRQVQCWQCVMVALGSAVITYQSLGGGLIYKS
jgi:hypothetical protein